MAPRKRAKTEGSEPVKPPKISCQYNSATFCPDKSQAAERLKVCTKNVRSLTIATAPRYKVSTSSADITLAATLITNDISRIPEPSLIPEPSGKACDDLFAAEPQGVLFAAQGTYQRDSYELYDAEIAFDEPVLLKSVTVFGLNLGVTTATLSIAPSNFKYEISFDEKTLGRSRNIFTGPGSPHPPVELVKFEPLGFVGQRFKFCERLQMEPVHPENLRNAPGLCMPAAYRASVKLEYERYTPGEGAAGLPSLSADLGALVDHEELFDVTFVCAGGGGEVRAVKALLAARCSYFRTMLFGAHRESRLERVNVECSAPALRFVVAYLHTGGTAMPRAEPPEVLIDAHKLADQYLLPPLQAYCLHALDTVLTTANCQQSLLIAHRRGLRAAKIVCLRYVVDNYDDTFEAMDALIEANEPVLLKEVFAAAKIHMEHGETCELGDHTDHAHF